MKNIPVWKVNEHKQSFPSLVMDVMADVAIIGGGITGITTAYLLSQAGKKVVVLEAFEVGGTTTGYSTGNLYSIVDEQLHNIKKNFNLDKAKAIAESRTEAINKIESLIKQFSIDCDFQRVPWYLFSETEKDNDKVQKELEACIDCGLTASQEQNFPLPFKTLKAIKVENQAQINPYKYITQLASKVNSATCSIYENSKVEEITEENGKVILKTAKAKVTTSHVVMATHTPKGFMPIQTLLYPYREYALAFELKDQKDFKGMFWGMQNNNHHSIRTYDNEGVKYLLVLGEPHKVGQKEDNNQCLKDLESYIRSRMDVGELKYWWGAQHYKSGDGLPYIGPHDSDSLIHYATGYSTDGLTYGTLAAMILSDAIAGKENKWAEVYSPSRFNPQVSAKDFIKENANVMMQYIKDLPKSADVDRFSEVKEGEGKTIEVDGEKCAAYRNENGELQVVSAVCPHMKCIVHFNQAEKTWDCPCHGSRFKTNGEVIEGPAISALGKINYK